jgi:hypothetical protein
MMGLSMHRDVNFTINCYLWDGRLSAQFMNVGEYRSRGILEKILQILPYIQRSRLNILQVGSLVNMWLTECMDASFFGQGMEIY